MISYDSADSYYFKIDFADFEIEFKNGYMNLIYEKSDIQSVRLTKKDTKMLAFKILDFYLTK